MPEEVQDKEINYLLDTFNGVQYDKDRFKVMIGEEKYLFGVVSGVNSASAPLSKLMQYKTLYDTLRDLDCKIEILQKQLNMPIQINFREISLYFKRAQSKKYTVIIL